MDDAERYGTTNLARLIPTLRATYENLPKTLPDDPVARHAHALLAQILTFLESRDGTPPEPHLRRRTD